LNHHHSHFLESVKVLRYSSPLTDTKERFLSYFDDGARDVASAMARHKAWLEQQQAGVDAQSGRVIEADARLNPSDKQVQGGWLVSWRNQHFGTTNATVGDLKVQMQLAKDRLVHKGVVIEVSEGDHFAVAVQNPIMRRTADLHSAGQVVYTDSTSNIDSCGTTLTLLMVQGAVFALPLLAILTRGLAQQDYEAGFTLARKILGPHGWGGQPNPQIFMMDDDEQMSEAIKNVLTPDQVLAGALIILRCVFHTLKAIWAWMWEKKNGMEKEHRPLIMGAVRKMMFAKTKFECLIWCIIAIQRAKKLAAPQKLTYPKAFKEYLLTKYSRRQEMCVAYRKGLLTRGQNTNNISERAVRTVKEDAFMRILSYNPVTVVDVLTNEFEEHFRSKLKDVANNRHPAQLTIPREYAVLKDRVKHISAADIKISKDPLWTHVVPSSSTEGVLYYVNMTLGICECPQGDNGSLCKH
ncbi:unnamed protein product, partial [Heterosigma akashiwo]